MRRQTGSPRGSEFPAFMVIWAATVLGLLGASWLFIPALGASAGARSRAPALAPTAPSSRPRRVAQPLAPLPALEPIRAEPVAGAPSAGLASSAGSAIANAAPALASAIPSAALAPRAVTFGAASALAAERTRLQEPVVRVLWQHRGLCSDDSATTEGSQRARYLAEFVSMPAPWGAKLFAYPGVPGRALDLVRQVVPALPARVETFLGLAVEVPVIYVHKSPQALRQYACVNDATVAYYDGSIHVSVSGGDNFVSEMTKSVEHEYVHHALLSHDITRPIWFQEGAALIFAKESWDQYRFMAQPIPLATMVEAFAHTVKPEQAEAFYLEAYGMVRLLRALWKKTDASSEADLVDALLDRHVTPDALFQTVLQERGGDSSLAPLDQLQAFISNGFRLDPKSPSANPAAASSVTQ